VIKEDSRRAASIRRAALGTAVLALGLLTAACSQTDADNTTANFSSDPETAKIEKVVRSYLLSNPEILEEMIQAREGREMAKAIAPHRKDIETPFAAAWAGARDGDVVLVEFFDYACTYCRASNPDIAKLLSEDKKLKVVWRELPVLGEGSLAAANVSLAAAKQGRFKKFHDTLYAEGGPTPDAIAKAQKAAGVAPMQSPEFMQEIDKNNELARALGATGTPTWVVGDRILSGAVGYQALKDAIAEARKRRA